MSSESKITISKRTGLPKLKIHFKPAIIHLFREKIHIPDLLHEASAGITVGIVALPLAMAFAIASGLPPQTGLYTAIIGGFLISALGGSRVQIGGPTGAFVVVIFEVVQRHGYEGLVIATFMAGVILIISGLFRFGRLVKFIPYPVTTGFTTGIAAIIFSTQVNEFFGLGLKNLPSEFAPKWEMYLTHFSHIDPPTFVVGFFSIVIIILARKFSNRIPGPLLAILFAGFFVAIFDLPVETIGDRFGKIPSTFPQFNLNFLESLSLEKIRVLFPDAFTIAFLAGVESLLSAVVADGMTGTRHDSDTELTAQGIANIASVAFGGIPATGAIARTATNIKNGAKTPLAGIVHALTVLLFTVFLAPYAAMIPLAALASILFVVAYHMSELDHFIHMFKAPVGDSLVMLIVFLLTIFFDLTVAVEVGVVFSAFLFMKRMSDMSGVMAPVNIVEDSETPEPAEQDSLAKKDVPHGVMVYEIQGPFFFGVADKLKGIVDGIEIPPKIIILRMRKVPVVDSTGVYALKEFYHKCKAGHTRLVLSGVSPVVRQILGKMGVTDLVGSDNITPHIDVALQRSRDLLNETSG